MSRTKPYLENCCFSIGPLSFMHSLFVCVCAMCDVVLQFTQIQVLHSILASQDDSISSQALFSSKISRGENSISIPESIPGHHTIEEAGCENNWMTGSLYVCVIYWDCLTGCITDPMNVMTHLSSPLAADCSAWRHVSTWYVFTNVFTSDVWYVYNTHAH